MHPWVAGAKNRKPIKWQLWKANLKMRCNYNESEHKLLYFGQTNVLKTLALP